MKKIFKSLIVLLLAFFIAACTTNSIPPANTQPSSKPKQGCDESETCDIDSGDPKNKGKDFKENYESINGQKTKSGKTYREITIEVPNNFIEIDDAKLAKLLADPAFNGIILASDPKCPWCRSVLPDAVKIANEMQIEKIYVLNIWDEDGNEIWRDKYKLDDNKKPELIVTGSQTYLKLLDIGKDLLNDYTLKDEDGNEYSVGEKRILIPTFMYIKNGKMLAFETGISDLQEDAYQDLTEEIHQDMQSKLKDFFTKALTIN